ncbi:hypothetical protein [Crocosphaera sp. XPORK-15E]|uniref:hypothetical protein n=1 Tax=Crocosphaera sp. XPORK-15E TaxID=3110247 RepID=UPI002B20E23E|nr:hypothetical protein [Crocosphaera sp. XPORK-15E]MEA5533105.1 hypothetical protein [Crocosphaera sp. XPORK-15E]
MKNQPMTNNEEYPAPNGELPPEMKHYGRTREEQIKINQKGLEIMRQWREEAEKRAKTLTPEEIQQELEAWKMVEETIDKYRERKLFTKE